MSTTIVIPAGTSYVAGSVLLTVFLLLGQTYTVGEHQGLSGIKYPQLYADKAQMDANPKAIVFNCVQRAHQNTLKNLPLLYSMTLITSLKYPILAASLLRTWSLGRVGYTVGYSTGDPKKRSNALSALHYPILLTM
ncbi:hypothetical protein DFH07DRAFT_1038642 [Mycena maculata]|uniref:Membrane-associated proteins in eicosanoid and glutathione metabolism n=1 Tax=Mycena maculata TaxID=230809 RepID=A0AAD7IMK2_9AGAR|nr:hypothetical protein DFH07DRAFT_1038642 [Mycena maculata]